MKNTDFLGELQWYAANVAVGASTLRNQGPKCMVATARKFLAKLDLRNLSTIGPSAYPDQLDSWTRALKGRFPPGGRHWGAARKVLNIFLLQASMNNHLRCAYRLDRMEKCLEVPLDRTVAKKIEKEASKDRPRGWHGVKHLQPEVSKRYQDAAAKIAKKKGRTRAELDILWWRREKGSPPC